MNHFELAKLITRTFAHPDDHRAGWLLGTTGDPLPDDSSDLFLEGYKEGAIARVMAAGEDAA